MTKCVQKSYSISITISVENTKKVGTTVVKVSTVYTDTSAHGYVLHTQINCFSYNDLVVKKKCIVNIWRKNNACLLRPCSARTHTESQSFTHLPPMTV